MSTLLRFHPVAEEVHFCATEPGGSDRSIIEGRKSWLSSATGWISKGADLLSVLCRTDPEAPPEGGISVLVVERPTPGIVLARAIDSLGHRAHLLPCFQLGGVSVPRDSVLGNLGGGLALTAACFTSAAALVGIFAVALMRAAFDFALNFAGNEKRGGFPSVIEHQAVEYALAGPWGGDQALAIECAKTGIHVNAVSPGIIKTPMHLIEAHQAWAALHPMGRMGDVSDIMDVVLYLDGAGFVTGEILHVDGGQAAGHHVV